MSLLRCRDSANATSGKLARGRRKIAGAEIYHQLIRASISSFWHGKLLLARNQAASISRHAGMKLSEAARR